MFLDMFKHKGKFVSVVGRRNIKAYQNLYLLNKKKLNNGSLPLHPEENYWGDNDLARNIYVKKYFVKDLNNNLVEHRPEDLFNRVSSFIAAIETDPQKQEEWAERFYRYMYEGYFIPGGRVLAGAGDLYRLKTLANCFVSQIAGDNIEAIYDSAYECARTYSYGGGIGVDISVLRPKNSVVHNAADTSTGAVSFMDLFSLTTGLIGQSGRRGALMLTIDVKHPDVIDFIRVKKTPNWVTKQIVEQLKWSNLFDYYQLKEIEKQVMENTQVRFANISIKASDEFMQAVYEQKTYGADKILVYKKFNKSQMATAYLEETQHYSIQIPAKDIEEYELFKVFGDISSLNDFLYKNYELIITETDLGDPNKRDVYGDLVLPLDKEPFDLAVKYSGDFMLYFASKPTGEIRRLIKAREVWDAFVEGNYKTAEPGLIFWSKMSKYSPSNYVGRPISSTNPCAEVPLEDGGACNLASINLSRLVRNGFQPNAEIEWETLKQVTRAVVRFLDNVVSWNEVLNPLEKQRRAASETRRLGLGIMGAADMLNQLNLGYDSEQGIALLEKVMQTIADEAYQASAELAAEKGPSPIFDYEKYSQGPFFKEALSAETKKLIQEKGLRNIAILSIAPTGSISNIALGFKIGDKHYLGVSSGIEPIFALYYTRRAESFGNQFFKVFHSTVQAYIDLHNLQDKVVNAQTEAELTEYLPPHFFRTAHHINAEKRVEIQGKCQRYVDHSISSTVNLPETIEPEVISNIYLMAWKKGLKGITIYRDGSRYPILSVDGQKTEFQKIKEKLFKILLADTKEEVTLKGDDIIQTPDGKLTTVYHYLKSTEQNNS
ncbi:ribonucleoside-diphosphate reductase, adenosylcobalamin-dependent [Caldithrix abyssi DSM 13497]|uniref:Vitamin B12-dependent ribonucleotide reductase n=2 Tax=Caldithrix abyssi DSM 13497 TaxID=880073 RepID=H1XRA0_CALAY|nr:adenosylcobalamin-dependent ribonucleoside-diphosphate reductase [Caldithrix abyssi]EHO41251.1 ribonucleoside-diphosphate reductase, adenosylcobalamin-dependent [Caldithrix abyssi DSM 13497]